MKLMSVLMMALMTSALLNNNVMASTLKYDINDEHNCTNQHVSQGERINFVVGADSGQDGSMIVVATTNLNAKLYKDGQNASNLLIKHSTTNAFAKYMFTYGVFARLDTAGDYRLVTTSSGQGSVCVARPS